MNKYYLLKLIILFYCITLVFSCKMDKEKQFEIYSQALEKANENDYDNALKILENNINKIDRKYFYYFYHGLFLQQKSLLMYTHSALKDYHKAYKYNPNKFEINDMIGSAYNFLDEYEKAIPYLERAYELFSSTSGAIPPYWNLAEAYFHVGRIEEALEMNTKAIIEKNDFSWSYLQRGMILSYINNDIHSMIENYEIAKLIEPDNLLLDRDYALGLIQLGYSEEAYQLYADWLIGNENYYDFCYADMGYILLLKKDWNKSIDMLKKAEKIDNTSLLTMQYLSFYYFFMKEYEKAYSYEAQARLNTDPSGVTYWRKSKNDFLEVYKNNWQFQKLLQQY